MENYSETKSSINYVGVLAKQTYIEILQLWRTPLYLSGILIFASLIVFFPVKPELAKFVLIFFGGLVLVIIAVERLGKRISIERVEGWFRLLQISPLPPTIFIGAKLICTLLICGLVLILMYIAEGFKLGWSVNVFDWLRIFFALIVGIIPFAFFGVAMGYLCNPKSLDSIIALLLPVALLTCGLPVPFAENNKWFQYVVDILPFSHYGKFVKMVGQVNIPLLEDKQGFVGKVVSKLSFKNQEVVNQDHLITHVLYLLIFAIVFYLISVWAYKRDQSLS